MPTGHRSRRYLIMNDANQSVSTYATSGPNGLAGDSVEYDESEVDAAVLVFQRLGIVCEKREIPSGHEI